METAPIKITGATGPDLVVALFTESHSAHGAIADLESVGFRRDRVAIAFSPEGKRAEEISHKGHWGEPTPPESEYSLAWRFRHWIEHDLHRQGAEQMSAKRISAVHHGEEYSEVDLHYTLEVLGVPEVRIQLVDQILGASGVLVLVDAAERTREAEVILERNCGQIRTDTVIGYAA
jgi:hypothetical protein